MQKRCYHSFDLLTLQWMDFFNSTIVPFLIMIILSISLIRCVKASRLRLKSSNTRGDAQLRRDNRFAVMVVSLNLLFLVLNLPILIDDILGVETDVDRIFDYFCEVLYFLYYAINFYIQLIVNSDFRHEALKLFRLKYTSKSFWVSSRN